MTHRWPRAKLGQTAARTELATGAAPPMRLVSKVVFEAGKTADEIVKDARKASDQMTEEARREVEALRQANMEKAAAKAENEVTRLVQLLTETQDQLMRQCEPVVIELAVAVAERILRRELDTQPATIAEIVATALLEIRSPWAGPVLVIRMHSDDIENVQPYHEELAAMAGEHRTVRFEADPNMPRKGCRIETAAGSIDADLATQLQVLRGVLTQAIEQRSEDGRARSSE